MQSESTSVATDAMGKRAFTRRVMKSVIAVGATGIAAVALLLPWDLRIRYARVLRWFRNLSMQNSRAVRKWAFSKRWEWDNNEEQ